MNKRLKGCLKTVAEILQLFVFVHMSLDSQDIYMVARWGRARWREREVNISSNLDVFEAHHG